MNRLVTGVIAAGALTVATSIPTSLIFAHDRLNGFAAAPQTAPARAPSPADIVATAKQYLGDSYATIGDSPSTGFSCIGFVHFVFSQQGVDIPYDIPMAWGSAPHVAMSDLMPGDVVFFSNTVFAGLSHVAIYIGNGQMIGADSFAVGVTTDTLGDSYWMNHYTGATRPLATLGTAPAPGSGAQSQPTATATPVPTQAPPPMAPVGAALRPLSATVGVYSGPDYTYTSIGTLSPATLLTVVQEQGAWYNVRFGATYGWVNAADVQPVDASPAAQPTPAPQYANASAVSSAAPGTVLVVADGPLWVRSGPGKSYSPLGFLKVGVHVTVLGIGPHWVRISGPTGLTGWVALQYLAPVGASQTAGKQDANSTALVGVAGRVTASVLNVRSLPDSHAHVLTVLFLGERVHIVSQQGTWYRVRLLSGVAGWVNAAYISTR